MLCLLTSLYNNMPEVGDLEKPKLAFFIDEAHLLFEDMSDEFGKKIEQIVRYFQKNHLEEIANKKVSVILAGLMLSNICVVNAAEGDTAVIPQSRNYKIRVRDLAVNGKELVFEIKDAATNQAHTVTAENAEHLTGESKHERAIRIFSRWQGFSLKKEICCRLLGADGDVMKTLDKMPLPHDVRAAINEELESE